MNTANLLQGIVYNSDTLRSLYNGSLTKNVYKQPHILSINNDNIGTRYAKFYQNTNNKYDNIKLILVSMDNISRYVNITINITKYFRKIRCNLILNKNVFCRFMIHINIDKYINFCFINT